VGSINVRRDITGKMGAFVFVLVQRERDFGLAA
jgi:hypothetical protein